MSSDLNFGLLTCSVSISNARVLEHGIASAYLDIISVLPLALQHPHVPIAVGRRNRLGGVGVELRVANVKKLVAPDLN